jgi:hypothetical protein
VTIAILITETKYNKDEEEEQAAMAEKLKCGQSQKRYTNFYLECLNFYISENIKFHVEFDATLLIIRS